MFIHYRTRGFILKKADRGEADQLLTVFTKDFGKLEISARGIRKISSKLRAGAEIFYLSEIEFIQGKSQKTLTDAVPIEKFKKLRKSLKRIKIAYKISESLNELISGQEPDERIWRLLGEIFEQLNDFKIVRFFGESEKLLEKKLEAVYYYFFWNLLSILGYEPELHHCVFCRKKLVPEKLYFSPKEGGVICQKCSKELKLIKPLRQVFSENREIAPESVKILRIILKKNRDIFLKLKIEKPDLKFLNKITAEYFSYIRRIC